MGIANPIAQILSVALLLRFALGLEKEAVQIGSAVKKVIDDGLRTGDIFSAAPGTKKVNTKEIGAPSSAGPTAACGNASTPRCARRSRPRRIKKTPRPARQSSTARV